MFSQLGKTSRKVLCGSFATISLAVDPFPTFCYISFYKLFVFFEGGGLLISSSSVSSSLIAFPFDSAIFI